MHDSTNCPVCQGHAIDGSMTDEQFDVFLNACRDELVAKQGVFNERIGGGGQWHYDLADCSLTVGDERFTMTPVGTHSPTQQTWLWAWANEDYPEVARETSRQLQSLYDLTGFRVFIDPGIPASSGDAQDFIAMAIHQLDAIGLFRAPSENPDGPTLFMAVHAEP